MAQIYSTGPVAIYLGIGPAGNPTFFGHGRQAPRIRRQRLKRPVSTDLSGMMPHDSVHAGKSMTVSFSLQRFNRSVLDFFLDECGARTNTPDEGIIAPGDVGSLDIEEGIAPSMWLVFPKARSANFQRAGNGAMPAGYFLPAISLDNDDEEDGWSPQTFNATATVLPVFNPAFLNPAGQGAFTLYRKLTVADINALPPMN